MMASTWRILIILLWCACAQLLGLYLFSKGFLLNRVEIHNVSSCVSDDSAPCARRPQFRRLIVIVVDALRYDFATSDSTLKNPKPFQNKMPAFERLQTLYPDSTKLMEFVADPPTTTMQRLKGLTTGSLPTFVDIGANFDGYRVTEDNLLAQLYASGKSVVFAGDDTWTNLFPSHFLRQYPYPSFNVRDLHTVDEGVRRHILPEMERDDWTVLVGHMLGVDHCGHRYGPDHPEMGSKLKETNEFIERVAERMENDTLLIVLGDHGMTSFGDHGGDSDNELSAALFVHGRKPFVDHSRDVSRVPQIDLVPTLSLLMGTPVPFSNLGKPILSLFPSLDDQLFAVDATLRQVERYLRIYAGVSNDIPIEDSRLLSKLYEDLSSVSDRNRLDLATRYLETVREVCEKIWAKFNVTFIVLGLFVIFLSIVVVVTLFSDTRIFVVDDYFQRLCYIFAISTIVGVLELIVPRLVVSPVPVTEGIVSFTGAILGVVLVAKRAYVDDEERGAAKAWHRLRRPSIGGVAATVAIGFWCASAFSNSFVVGEDRVVAFVFNSLLWFVVVHSITKRGKDPTTPQTQNSGKSKAPRQNLGDWILHWKTLLVLATLAVSCLVALSRYLGQACREEQFWCDSSWFLEPLSSFQRGKQLGAGLNIRYFGSVFVLVGTVYCFQKLLRHDGNLSGESVPVLTTKFFTPLLVVFLSLHWASHEKLPAWQQAFMPRAVYVLVGALLLVFAWNPLLLYFVHFPSPFDCENTRLNLGYGSAEELVRLAYRRIKTNWREHLKSSTSNGDAMAGTKPRDVPPPHAFGLATAYSSSIIVVSIALFLLISMVLGDGLVFALICYLGVSALWLEIYSSTLFARPDASKTMTGSTFAAYLLVPWWAVVGWGLLVSVFYFYTGHQSSIPNIPWTAAFHGVNVDHAPRVIVAALVSLNLFASDVLGALSLPLLILWPYARGGLAFTFSKRYSSPVADQKHEVALQDNQRVVSVAVLKLVLAYLLFASLRLFSATAAAALHRRHLMVWKIFAPRFVFEGARFVVVAVSLVASVALFFRIDAQIRKWLTNVQERIVKK